MANTPEQRAARLAVAAASPDAANRRARAEWLGLYASNAEVHDPVGTPACRKDAKTRPETGKNDLELFYDTFIAGMKSMSVDVKLDVVVGDVVARDVILRPTMSFDVKSEIPTRLLYELVDENGKLAVRCLGAYWDASQATQRTMSKGLRGKASMMVSSARMARFLGRAWMQRYVAGTKKGARRPGREAVLAFSNALRSGDVAAAKALGTDGLRVRVCESAPMDFEAFVKRGHQLVLSEPIASGDFVTALCSAVDGGRKVEGLAFIKVDRDSHKLSDVRLLWE